jgi:hypothetical protein
MPQTKGIFVTTDLENFMTDVNTDKIIDRVKKMMALANCSGAAEGERDNALRMAYNLLAKHNLSMSQVEAHDSTPQEQRESQKATFVVYPWARSIAGLVGDLFFCNYYFMRSHSGKQADHVFIGKASNVATAQYMSEFVVKSVCREAARLYGSAIAPEARCFAIGVVRKLQERIREIKDSLNKESITGTALVLVDLANSERTANALWLADQGIKLKTSASRTKGVTDSDAFHAGKDFGARVSLSPQVGASRSTTKAISN